ncbi:protein-L-isoaspartate O-methyltransferase family protein [Phycicoccus ginsengisoli]
MADPRARVAAALEAVPRRWFLPADQVRHADRDEPLPIGHGQTNSQPTTVRAMLELLDVQPGDRVLDVGCGSGWTTALLAHLAGPQGSVVGVELLPDLVVLGTANVERAGARTARVHEALPGHLGWPAGAPYDRVLVSAQARELPADLVAQLAPGGVMVVPVAGRMLRVRNHDGGPVVEEHGWYRFVPLVTGPPAEGRGGQPV